MDGLFFKKKKTLVLKVLLEEKDSMKTLEIGKYNGRKQQPVRQIDLALYLRRNWGWYSDLD